MEAQDVISQTLAAQFVVRSVFWLLAAIKIFSKPLKTLLAVGQYSFSNTSSILAVVERLIPSAWMYLLEPSSISIAAACFRVGALYLPPCVSTNPRVQLRSDPKAVISTHSLPCNDGPKRPKSYTENLFQI